MSKEPRDKAACRKAYHRNLKSIDPKYKYHFRLWITTDLYEIADEWGNRDKSLDKLVEQKYGDYVNGEKFLRDSNVSRSTSQSSMKTGINTIFTKFQKLSDGAEDEPDLLFDEGFDQFFSKVLKIEKTPINCLILSYILGAEYVGEISRQEFEDGFKVYGIYTETTMSTLFTTAVKNLTSTDLYAKDLYTAAWLYANESIVRNTLSVPIAIRFWKMLTPKLFPNFQTLPDWILWLTTISTTPISELKYSTRWLLRHDDDNKGGNNDSDDQSSAAEIRIDLWLNFYDFVLKMKDDYVNNYDFNGGDAWNTALDQFVFDFLDLEYATDDIA